MIFEAIQNLIAFVIICKAWLSSIKSWYSSLHRVSDSKHCYSYSSPVSLSVHLLLDIAIWALGSAVNYALLCCLPLKQNHGLVRCPTCDIHLINVAYSRLPGWVIYILSYFEIITLTFPIYPIITPFSSILCRFSGLMSYSWIVVRYRLNQCAKFSGS